MRKTDINWKFLATTNDSTEREFLSNELFLKVTDQFVSSALTLIDQEFYVLTTQARRIADGYWRFNIMMREDGGKENQGYFGTRVRAIGTTLSIVWHLNTLYRDKYNPTGPMKVLSHHIKKGSGWKYSMASFKRAKDWEYEAIEEVESLYADIRKRAAALAKMRRALRAYAVASGLSLTVNDTTANGANDTADESSRPGA